MDVLVLVLVVQNQTEGHSIQTQNQIIQNHMLTIIN